MDKDFWAELFVKREDIRPPGYDDVIAGFTNNPYVTKAQKKAARSSRKGKTKYPSAKHSTQD